MTKRKEGREGVKDEGRKEVMKEVRKKEKEREKRIFTRVE